MVLWNCCIGKAVKWLITVANKNKMKAKILSTFDYNNKNNEELVNNFILTLYKNLDGLLSNNSIIYDKTQHLYAYSEIEKGINKIKKNLLPLISDTTNIAISDLKSKTINMAILNS